MNSYKKLFPQLEGFVHGGDYNPEQWLDEPEILKEDIRLMKKANINCVTMGMFSWSSIERYEGEFDFSWLENMVNTLYENGIYSIIGTPSGARPAWLDKKYPDAMRVDEMGIRNFHGVRHNHCMSSQNYRNKVREIDSRLAKLFAHNPAVIMWHISNEFGGFCYCDNCKKKFQNYLSDRYDGDIDKLNKAWWATFWSHTYNSFDEIEPPYKNGEFSVMGLLLDWRRFNSFNHTDFMNFEIDILRAENPDIPVTTNYMCMFEDIDYREMSKNLDVVSWDSYPHFHNNWQSLYDTFLEASLNHSLFRSMKKDRPFMLMESAPGLVNWTEVNKYRRPGVHALACMQAVASGSDTVQYFQIRKGRGSFEQFHGAVIDHVGTAETRIFKEVADVGEKLKKIKEVAGSLHANKVAILYDWDNRWAIKEVKALSQESKQYDRTVIEFYRELQALGVEADIISSEDDFEEYKVIIAPMLFLLHDGVGEKIKAFVEKGGSFLSTYFTGYVDKTMLCYLGGFPGQGLMEVFGIRSEEIDTLYPEDENTIVYLDSAKELKVREYQEYIHALSAKVLAEYKKDYVKGSPAVTVNEYGSGKAYYAACRLYVGGYRSLLERMLLEAGVDYSEMPYGVLKLVRENLEYRYEFYLNTDSDAKTVDGVCGSDLLSGGAVDGKLTLEGCQIAVVKVKK